MLIFVLDLCDKSNGWISYFECKCYSKVSSAEAKYSIAKKSCEDVNSKLVEPKSTEEVNFIVSKMKGQDRIWNGINDIEQEGKYVTFM